MLVLRAAELSGDVIVPSFTFAATAHAVAVERPAAGVRRHRPADADALAGRGRASGRRAHVGDPRDAHLRHAVRRRRAPRASPSENGLRLFFDAAHAFGSMHGGTKVGGFGDAEVFSLSPTKVVVAAEGGVIATNDDLLAERCRIGRDYGNPGDYDCRFVGLNARMSELHAATALASLEDLDERLAERNRLAAAYTAALAGIPGIRIPEVPAGDRSTYKDYSILIDADGYGLDADAVAERLRLARDRDPPVLLASRPRHAGLRQRRRAGRSAAGHGVGRRAGAHPAAVGGDDGCPGQRRSPDAIRADPAVGGGRGAYAPSGQERYGARPMARPRSARLAWPHQSRRRSPSMEETRWTSLRSGSI